MKRCSRTCAALLLCSILVTSATAQTTTTGGTGGSTGATGGTTTTGTGGMGGGMGGSSSGGASRAGSTSGSSGSPFAGTVQSGFSGGNAASTATNTTRSGTGSGTSVPTSTNPWVTNYGNPYGLGQTLMGSSSSGSKTGAASKGFGQPIYSTSTTSVGTTGSLNNTSTAAGFNNSNMSKTPRYTTNLSDDVPYVAHAPAQLQANLQAIIARSTRLKNKDQIRVVVDGDTVALVGRVGSASERGLAENVLRFEPGVRNVNLENRLTFPGQP
jgi:hypothetical protein